MTPLHSVHRRAEFELSLKCFGVRNQDGRRSLFFLHTFRTFTAICEFLAQIYLSALVFPAHTMPHEMLSAP